MAESLCLTFFQNQNTSSILWKTSVCGGGVVCVGSLEI